MLIPTFRPRSSAVLALVSRTARGLFPWHFFQDPCDRVLVADVATWTRSTGVGRGFTPAFVLDARALARAIQADQDRLWAVEVGGWRHTCGAPRIIIGTPWDGRPEEIIGRLAAALEARRKPPRVQSENTPRTSGPREWRDKNRAIWRRAWDRL